MIATLAGPTSAADDLENGAFRQEVLALLSRRRPQWKFEPAGKSDTIVSGSKRLYLGNLFDLVQGRRDEDRESHILEFADAVVTVASETSQSKTFEEIRSQLRVRIVPASYETNATPENIGLVLQPLSIAARLACAIDGRSAIEFVTTRHLRAWSMAANPVLATAIGNLDDASQDVEIKVRPERGGPGRFATVNVADSYAAARLLAPRFMTRVREQLGPKVFVGVPNRDFLVAWSTDFSKKSDFAAQVTKDAASKPYPLTDELFVSSAQELRVATAAERSDHGRS